MLRRRNSIEIEFLIRKHKRNVQTKRKPIDKVVKSPTRAHIVVNLTIGCRRKSIPASILVPVSSRGAHRHAGRMKERQTTMGGGEHDGDEEKERERKREKIRMPRKYREHNNQK